MNQELEKEAGQAPGRAARRRRRPGACRAPGVYLGALLLTVGLAVCLSLVFGGSGSPPAGRILAAGEGYDVSRPALSSAAHFAPELSSAAEWEAVLPTLQKAAEEKPDDATVQRQIGLAYYNVGRLEEARALYEKLLAAKEDAVLRNRLGNVLRDLGDLEDAEQNYCQATVNNPELSDPYMNLAEILWRMHRDNEAAAVLERGLSQVSVESRPVLENALRVVQSGASSTDASV